MCTFKNLEETWKSWKNFCDGMSGNPEIKEIRVYYF